MKLPHDADQRLQAAFPAGADPGVDSPDADPSQADAAHRESGVRALAALFALHRRAVDPGQLRHDLGLDEPFLQQLFRWFSGLKRTTKGYLEKDVPP